MADDIDGVDESFEAPDDGYVESENFVAVVGMAGRFPESPDIHAFWDNLRAGRDCLHTFTDDEIDALGIPAERVNRDNFVRRGTVLPDRDRFDARFFGYTPKQAGVMDPQARIFLETCYEALEHAGYDPFAPGCPVGVFAGSNPNDYALLLGVADPTDSLSAFDQLIGVDRDFVATRVSHKLGLTGPAMTIQTACSTSLVTVHAAAQSLLAYECSMALAGGVSINLRQGIGYFYQPGMILSPTGECRAFDANAQGTTLGQGCGVVALKRLADAQDDGDHILAVIRATVINNDGGAKISYTAPSEDGQAEVIAAAHALAGVDSDSIGYVETHGTGTLLGDPIEVAALTRAFKPGTTRQQYCAIGSAKTNFGHTDAAAGITGFIKAVLTLYHGEIPPSIHFDEPNPDIDFANSPFFVNTELRPFPSGPTPRRAGVSAFGIGGTNAHVVLEEAPTPDEITPSEVDERVLVVSARSAASADERVSDLASALSKHDSLDLEAIDYTLRHGRPQFEHRRAIVVGPDRSLADTVNGETDGTVVRGNTAELAIDPQTEPRPVWLFAGQGGQYPGMGRDLYTGEPVFRQAVDRLADHLAEPLGVDLRTVLFPNDDGDPSAAERLRQTSLTQPALFAVEHATAELLRSWGQQPKAVIGHSIGEYAAAVEAGILAWDDAATLVAERGRLMQSMEPGSMLSVSLPAEELLDRLPTGAELAAYNSSALSVASGPTEVIEGLAAQLEGDGISSQVLHTSHAFHSATMNEAADRFADVVAGVRLSAPDIPLISNVTGTAITRDQAVDPKFWADQIRRPVRFAECLSAAAESQPTTFVELGPGRALSTFVSAHQSFNDEAEHGGPALAVPTMRHPRQARNDRIVLLEAMGRLWTAGLPVDWDLINTQPTPRRIPLPTYPFERTEAWLPAHRHVLALPQFGEPSASKAGANSRQPFDRWLYTPSWQRVPTGDRDISEGSTTVVLAPAGEPGDRLLMGLRAAGREVVEIRPALEAEFSKADAPISTANDERILAVFADLMEREVPVGRVVHAWSASPNLEIDTLADLERSLDVGIHTVLACARGLSPLSRQAPIRLDIVTTGAFSVTDGEIIRPDAAALLGPTKVIPLEYSGLTTRLIDVADGLDNEADERAVIAELNSSVPADVPDAVVALRGGQRWTPTVAVRSTTDETGTPTLRQGGRYLIVGGLGGVGLSIARFLAEDYRASLILTSRSGRPTPGETDDPEKSRRIDVLDEIDRLANSLDVLAVDASDESAMTAAIDRVETESGPIDGVIVAAGVADQYGAIHRRSRADMTASIASKVHGSLVLERALAGRDLDFVLLSSSIAATLYHNRFAQVGYVAGNAFVEAFALRGRQRGQRVITVAWDDWLDIGMSVRAAQDFSSGFGTDVDLVDRLNSFSPADGVRLFDRALRVDQPVVLVSPTDLASRIDDDVHVISPFLEQATGDDSIIDLDPGGGGDATTLIASIWSALLGIESFEPRDDFFELGGDSLQAARMADKLSRTLGTDIPVDMVFDNSVFDRMVDAVEKATEVGPDSGQLDADQPGYELPSVLGPAQLRFIDRQTEHPEHFNVSALLRPSQQLTFDHLHSALAVVVASHDALRLRMISPVTEEAHLQTISSPPKDLLTLVDLRHHPATAAMSELERSAIDVQQGLNLEQGPIVRFVLYELPADEQRLLVVMHHLVSDRMSLLLMLDALNGELHNLVSGGTLSEPRPATSFLQWVAAQAAAAGDSPELATWWGDQPWGFVAPLPVGDPSDVAENRNSDAAVVEVQVSSEQLAVVAERTGARPDEAALLALARAVAHWTDADAALIDVLGHGRRLPIGVDVSRSVGMFITYSPVVLVGTGGKIDSSLERLRSDLENGWTFDALRLYGPPEVRTTMDELPRADVLFNYVGRAIATEDDGILVAADEARGLETDPSGRRDHLLAVRADLLDDDGLKLVFVYSTALHAAATIQDLAQRTVDCLNDLGSRAT